jgi:anti-sigma factor RsiW
MMRLFRKRAGQRQQELLSAYLDGRLSERERAEVERLLESLPEARRELQSLRNTVAMLKETPVLKPRRSFAIQPSMVQERPKAASAGALRWAMPMAASAAVLFLTFSLIGGSIGLFEGGGGAPLSQDPQQFAFGTQAAPADAEAARPPAATVAPRVALAPTATAPAPFGTPVPTPQPGVAGPPGAAGPSGVASLGSQLPSATPAPTATPPLAPKAAQEDLPAILTTPGEDDGGFPWLALQISAGILTALGFGTLLILRRKKAL